MRVVLRFIGYYEDVMWFRKSNRLGGYRALRPDVRLYEPAVAYSQRYSATPLWQDLF